VARGGARTIYRITRSGRARIREETTLREAREVRRRIGKYAGIGVSHLLDHLAAQRELDRKWLHRVLKDVERDQIRDSNLPRLHKHLRRPPRRPRAGSVR